MMRKYYIVCLSLLLTVALSACGNNQGEVLPDSKIFYDAASVALEAASSSDSAKDYNRKTRFLSESWNNEATYDWQFDFGDTRYTMPLLVTNFLRDDYIINEYYDIDVDVEPGMTYYFEVEISGVEFYVGVLNKTTETIKALDCNLLSLSVEYQQSEESKLPEFVGPDGSTLGNFYEPTAISGNRLIIQDSVEDGNGFVRMAETLDGTENSFVLGTLNYTYEDNILTQVFIEYYGL